LVSGGLDGSTRLWDTRQQNLVKEFKGFHYDRINSIDKLSSSIVATASNDSFVNVRLRVLFLDMGYTEGGDS